MTSKAKLREEYLGRLGAENKRLKEIIEDSKSAYAIMNLSKKFEARSADVSNLQHILRSHGFRECDIMACNCGSWHQTGGFYRRFMEIQEVVEGAGYSTNGKTLLRVVTEIVTKLDMLETFLGKRGTKVMGVMLDIIARARAWNNDLNDDEETTSTLSRALVRAVEEYENNIEGW